MIITGENISVAPLNGRGPRCLSSLPLRLYSRLSGLDPFCPGGLSIPCLLLAVLLVDYRSQSPLVYTQLQIPDLNIKMLGSSKLSLVACLLTLLSSALVHAAPAANPRDALLAARQSAQPTTVQTSEMVETYVVPQIT